MAEVLITRRTAADAALWESGARWVSADAAYAVPDSPDAQGVYSTADFSLALDAAAHMPDVFAGGYAREAGFVLLGTAVLELAGGGIALVDAPELASLPEAFRRTVSANGQTLTSGNEGVTVYARTAGGGYTYEEGGGEYAGVGALSADGAELVLVPYGNKAAQAVYSAPALAVVVDAAAAAVLDDLAFSHALYTRDLSKRIVVYGGGNAEATQLLLQRRGASGYETVCQAAMPEAAPRFVDACITADDAHLFLSALETDDTFRVQYLSLADLSEEAAATLPSGDYASPLWLGTDTSVHVMSGPELATYSLSGTTVRSFWTAFERAYETL